MQETISRIRMILALRVAWLTLPVVLIIACNSGEYASTIKGQVLESETLVPIESAWIAQSESTDSKFYSDTLGQFTLAAFGRPDRVYAGKDGFKTHLFELPEDESARQNLAIELEKETPALKRHVDMLGYRVRTVSVLGRTKT